MLGAINTGEQQRPTATVHDSSLHLSLPNGGNSVMAGALYRATAPDYTGMGPRREPSLWEDKGMHLQRQWWSGLVAAMLGGLVGGTAGAAGGGERCSPAGVRRGGPEGVVESPV